MKKLIMLMILLTMPCVSISQISNLPTQNESSIRFQEKNKTDIEWKLETNLANYDSLKLPPSQVFNVYVGLKRMENMEKEIERLKRMAINLNNKIQKLNKDHQKTLAELVQLNSLIEDKNAQLVKKEGEIEKLKSKTKRFSIGPSAGLNYDGKINAGISVNYALFRF